MQFEILKLILKKKEENPPPRWRDFVTQEDNAMILATA